MAERAVPPAGAAGFGHVWVKDTSPTTPWFTDDDSDEFALVQDETTLTLTGDVSTQSDLNCLFDGCTLESVSVVITESGGTVSLEIEKTGGGDLNVRLGAETFFYDTSPADTIALTAGTDTVPVMNYVWLIETAGTVSLATGSAWPASAEYVAVATVLVQSAADVATDGPYKVHVWSDHPGGSQQGHLPHISRWIRTQPATWRSGVGANAMSVSAPDAYLSTDLGEVMQLHPHDFPAWDMSSGDPLYVVNEPGTAYFKMTSLDDIDQDSEGAGINNKWINLVLWGSINETSGDCKVFCNLPSGSYSSQVNAEADADGYSNFTIPAAYTGTGFLIANYIVKSYTSGTWVHGSISDLRGLFPSTSASTGGGGGVTDHGALSGLADDDHTQYSLVDGTRAFTGAVEIDSATAGLTVGEHSSSMGTPASGKVNVYAKADGLMYSKDDAGTETLMSSGAGGGGGTSVIAIPVTFEVKPIDSTWAGPESEAGWIASDLTEALGYGTGAVPVPLIYTAGIIIPVACDLVSYNLWHRPGASGIDVEVGIYKWTRTHDSSTIGTASLISTLDTTTLAGGLASTKAYKIGETGLSATLAADDHIGIFYDGQVGTSTSSIFVTGVLYSEMA
jgi:hypothetical protein